MPLYEFQCTSCDNRFERLQKMSDPEPSCPKCDSDTKQLISRSNFELKGTGWYKTDFKGS